LLNFVSFSNESLDYAEKSPKMVSRSRFRVKPQMPQPNNRVAQTRYAIESENM